MQPIYSHYVFTLFAAATGGLLILFHVRRYWSMTAARPFSLLMVCIVWWAFLAALSTIAPSAETAHFLGHYARFSAPILVSPAALLFALAHTGRTEWFQPRRLALLLAVPVLTLLLHWSSGSHELFIYDVVYQRAGGIWLRSDWSWGLWFELIFFPYNVVLVGITIMLFVHQARHSRFPYRQQALLVTAGALAPSAAALMATFDMLPGLDLDLVVLGFLFLGFTFYLALSRYQLLDFAPIAQSAIIENMTDAMMVLDNDGRVVEMNPAMHTRLGFTRRQALGRHVNDLFSTWPDLVEQYQDVTEGQFLVTIPGPEQPVHLDVHVSRLTDKGGRNIGVLVVWRDVTRLKETELALEASLQRVSILLQVAGSLSDFTNLKDLLKATANRVAWALPAHRAALIVFNEEINDVTHYIMGGAGADETEPIPFSELMAGLTGWALLHSQPALSPKGRPDPRESEAVRRRRQEVDGGSIIVVPLLIRERVLGTITVTNRPDQRDFTWNDVELLQALASQTAVAIENTRLYIAQQEQVKALQESNEDLEAFSYMVAHDLKGPLSTINTYSDLVLTLDREQAIPRERIVKYFESIYRTGRKMAEIINDLLLLAQIRRDGDVPLEPLDMKLIIEEVLDRLAWQIEDVSAEIFRPGSWPKVMGNGLWVEEIWANYISNALKYGGERPVVTLGCDCLDGLVHFWVKDNGPGLTAEEQSRLFVEFSRVGERKVKGHGLGLSIVRRITERMGGEVWVASRPGEGSTFYFSLGRAG